MDHIARTIIYAVTTKSQKINFWLRATSKKWWMLTNVLEQWWMSLFIIRVLIEFIDWIFKSLGRRSLIGVSALGWEQRLRNEQKIKILWPPFQLTISDTLTNWTSKIKIRLVISVQYFSIYESMCNPAPEIPAWVRYLYRNCFL